MSNTSTVSATLRQFHSVFWQETFTDGPTSALWIKFLSWGANGVLRVQAVFREYILCEYSQYFGVLYCGHSLYPKHPSISGSILRILRHLQYSYCSYSENSQYEALGTAHTHSTHSIQKYTRSTQYSICEIFIFKTSLYIPVQIGRKTVSIAHRTRAEI